LSLVNERYPSRLKPPAAIILLFGEPTSAAVPAEQTQSFGGTE